MHLLLIGLRASGKSTVGALVAARLTRPFVDLDDVTAARLNAIDAAQAIQGHGLPAFRAAEAGALVEVLAAANPSVIALGGGTPTVTGFRHLMDGAECLMVYLRATPDTLKQRLGRTDVAKRPSLTGKDTIEEVGDIFAARDEMYQRLADEVIDVDELDEASVAERVAAAAGQ